jgi:hypothetical protein
MTPYDPSYDPQFWTIWWTVMGIVIIFWIGFAVVLYVLMAVSLSSLFRKVGVESWIAWVPVYNLWKWLEVGGQQGWLALFSLLPYGGIVSGVFLWIGMYRTGIAFGKTGGFLVLGILLPFVWAFILGGPREVYRPELIAAAGYPPPRAGFGSTRGSTTPTQPTAAS